MITNTIRTIGASSLFVVAAAVFAVCGLLLPNSIGLLVNPSTELGSKFIDVLLLLCFVAFLALLVSVPVSIVSLSRHPEHRSWLRFGVIGFGTVVAAVLGVLILGVVASR